MKKNDDLITLPSHNSHALDYIIKKAFTIGEAIFFGTDLVIKLKPNISASGELFICQKD